MPNNLDRALTPRELARRWRTSPCRIKAMIRTGKLPAFEIVPGRPRVTPEAIAAAECGVLAVKPRQQKRREEIPAHILAMLAD